MAYVSGHLSLVTLEVLAHLINPRHGAFGAVEVGKPLPFDARILQVANS